LPLEQRVFEFCDKTPSNPFMRKAFRKRKFISNQNAAVFQYKIPYQGSFAISARYIHNPKRKQAPICSLPPFEPSLLIDLSLSLSLRICAACNIMAEGVAPFYVLQNYGASRNCTITALFPAVVSILAIDVGGNKGNVNYDVSLHCVLLFLHQSSFSLPLFPQCDHSNYYDKAIVGGSNGLDSSQMTKSAGVCGTSEIKGPEQAIFCGITSVRLESSGKHKNKAYVSVRQADENDMSLATAVCDL
jgi:hypothetical protein